MDKFYSIESVWGFPDKYTYFYLYGPPSTTRKTVDDIVESEEYMNVILSIYDKRIFKEGVTMKVIVKNESVNILKSILNSQKYIEHIE